MRLFDDRKFAATSLFGLILFVPSLYPTAYFTLAETDSNAGIAFRRIDTGWRTVSYVTRTYSTDAEAILFRPAAMIESSLCGTEVDVFSRRERDAEPDCVCYCE